MNTGTTLCIDPQVYAALENFQLPESLGFGSVFAPVMYRVDYLDGAWQPGSLIPFGPIPAPRPCSIATPVSRG